MTKATKVKVQHLGAESDQSGAHGGGVQVELGDDARAHHDNEGGQGGDEAHAGNQHCEGAPQRRLRLQSVSTS